MIHPSRYPSLDAWRGVAALAVLFWHVFANTTPLAGGLWLGVQPFFVISGYCIAAALDSAARRGMPARDFLKRRARRILPAYFASLGVETVQLVVVAAWYHGVARAPEALSLGARFWLKNLSLTQWATLTSAWLHGAPLATPWHNPDRLVSAHWSLLYEEQFYLLFALLLVLAPRLRPALGLGLLTVVGGLWTLAHPGLTTGLFVDFWLQFACGVALHARLCRIESPVIQRRFDIGLVVVIFALLGIAAVRGEVPFDNATVQTFAQLAVCAAFAGLLLMLRRFEPSVANWPPSRLIARVGAFSYSLYLTHQSIIAFCYPLRAALEHRIGEEATGLGIVALAIGFARVFHAAFERPFLNAPTPAPEPVPLVT